VLLQDKNTLSDIIQASVLSVEAVLAGVEAVMLDFSRAHRFLARFLPCITLRLPHTLRLRAAAPVLDILVTAVAAAVAAVALSRPVTVTAMAGAAGDGVAAGGTATGTRTTTA
jgi:hypothetical protein